MADRSDAGAAGNFDQLYRQSIDAPQDFWAAAAQDLDWIKPWDQLLDESGAPYFYRWFAGAQCNSCYNALDRHVANGRADQDALIYDSPLTGHKKRYSYRALLERVSKLAGALQADFGLKKGDRAIIYMPMIPEAVMAMLACARIGVIHSVVFGGFAAAELATRIRDAKPKAILTASCGVEPGRIIAYQPLVEEALRLAPDIVQHILVQQRPMQQWLAQPGRDHDWQQAVTQAQPADCVAVAATDPLYILYTSGTTGQPKGVIRDNGGHMVALHWSMRHIYGMQPGDVYWAASDVGWVVGHSYIVYGPLLYGCTTVLYEGKPVGTPDAGAFWRMIEEYKIAALFTAPTAFRAIKKEDPNAQALSRYDISSLRALFLAGERCDPDTLHWAERHLQVPVIDHWWQTETGWAIAANCLGLGLMPVKAGSPTKAVPGYDIRILGEDQAELPPGQLGAISIKLPLPPSCLSSLWGADQRFIDSYLTNYPGYYQTGDAGYIDEDGYLFVMARTDDIINVAGHRLSTGGMEEVLAGHPAVAECAVIGAYDALKGQTPIGFLVLKSGVTQKPEQIIAEVIQRVRDQIGPVAAFKHAVIVARLPKTRSGKILRATMVKIANGETYNIPATIDDPAILAEIAASLQQKA